MVGTVPAAVAGTPLAVLMNTARSFLNTVLAAGMILGGMRMAVAAAAAGNFVAAGTHSTGTATCRNRKGEGDRSLQETAAPARPKASWGGRTGLSAFGIGLGRETRHTRFLPAFCALSPEPGSSRAGIPRVSIR